MRNVARTNTEFQNLVGKHDDALQGGLMPFGFNVLHGLNDEGRRDLVDLLVAEGLNDVVLQSSTFIGITHDTSLFEIAPQKKGVPQRVTVGRFLSDVFAQLASFLFDFTIRNVWEVSETKVCNASVETLTENPSF